MEAVRINLPCIPGLYVDGTSIYYLLGYSLVIIVFSSTKNVLLAIGFNYSSIGDISDNVLLLLDFSISNMTMPNGYKSILST